MARTPAPLVLFAKAGEPKSANFQRRPFGELKQPFTNNLIDSILRDMSDEELDEVITRDAQKGSGDV